MMMTTMTIFLTLSLFHYSRSASCSTGTQLFWQLGLQSQTLWHSFWNTWKLAFFPFKVIILECFEYSSIVYALYKSFVILRFMAIESFLILWEFIKFLLRSHTKNILDVDSSDLQDASVKFHKLFSMPPKEKLVNCKLF